MKPYHIPKRKQKDTEEMATPEQAVQQGLAGNTMEIKFDPLKFISRMGEYNGETTAELVQFVNKVELLLHSMSNYSIQSQKFIVLQIRDKIVGKANTTLLRYSIDTTSWSEIKRILIENFSERNTFLQLHEKAEKVVHKNITQTYNELSNILTRMNNKYHLSTERSIDRTPESNEESILNLFKEKIPINAASIIISRNITTLFEAYRLLELNNWTRFDSKYKNYRNTSNFNKGNNANANRNNQQYNEHSGQSGNFRQNFQYNTQRNNIQQNTQNFQQNRRPQNFQQNGYQQNFQQNEHQQNFQTRTQFSRANNNTRQTRRQPVEPMEVDNVLIENFPKPASEDETYQ
ncbi:GATA zinc finger domain-containing protein 14-like [Bactrocera dorsalis]|uniref:GATA zinc finger domain-containing protein 14-like n=1 Tax=Bactrocera dorsalis TaxID=27457 RepID=A0ABM3JC29_BACDO|nr:GATA zinc finger domain-containing protein 14-like [Bactrocera dorsalis]